MKKLLVLFSVFYFVVFPIFGQEKIAWDYPIKPGTEEWKKLENNKTKVEACQIPENILRNISTNNLMTVCLQYPFLIDLFAFNNINDGLEKLFADFNGIREFSKREEAIDNLRKEYLATFSIFTSKLDTASTLEIGRSILHVSKLEMLLSYSEFYTNSTTKTKKEVLESLFYGYLEKIKYSEHFQGIGFMTNLFARAHLITKTDVALSEKFEGKDKSVLFSGMADADLINTIDSLSYKLIK